MSYPATKSDIKRLENLIKDQNSTKGLYAFTKPEKQILIACLRFAACFIDSHQSIRDKIGDAIISKDKHSCNISDMFAAIESLVQRFRK